LAKILIVEDDVELANAMLLTLELCDHQVEHKTDGLHGVQTARTFRPDIVIMDLNMYAMDGVSAIRYIIQRKLCKKIMVLTVLETMPDELNEYGITHFYTKPINLKKLPFIVKKILDEP
jgi:DNA-binding response OmpR family regulator